MKKIWCMAVLLVLACSGADNSNRLQELSGYWEIEKVSFPGGGTKEYTVNQTIDYFELRPDSTGFRKKLQPMLNGRFLATDDTERFKIEPAGRQLKIRYITAIDQWEEIILKIDKNRLIVKNNDNLTYFYKRFNRNTFETAR